MKRAATIEDIFATRSMALQATHLDRIDMIFHDRNKT